MTPNQYTFRYRVRNWSDYNRALIARGRLTCWFDEDAVAAWRNADPPVQLRNRFKSGRNTRPGIPFRGVSEKPSGRNRELFTECKSKINYCLKYIKFLILITYFRLIRIDTEQRSNLFFGVNVRYSLDHGAIFSRREWRWCMNRNWPATNPTHRSITYQEGTTMAYRARPSG